MLEASRIVRVDGAGGMGALTPWLTLPVVPEIFAWEGDSLALDGDGDFLVGAAGFFNGTSNGVMRIDASSQDVTVLDPSFKAREWLDLAVEADGQIVGVGIDGHLGLGVYRIDPSDGLHTRLDAGYPWQQLTGVAVDASGDIFVADAGLCSENGSCTGGEIVRVDPVDGSVTPLTSGGSIQGPMDLAALPEPGGPAALGLGALAVTALRFRRSRTRPAR